jgi:hypothetical protein
MTQSEKSAVNVLIALAVVVLVIAAFTIGPFL